MKLKIRRVYVYCVDVDKQSKFANSVCVFVVTYAILDGNGNVCECACAFVFCVL